MKKIIIIMAGVFLLTGCVTNPSIPVPVNDDRFDGVWKGSGSLRVVQPGAVNCSGSILPIYFKVKDRVATSLINNRNAAFNTQVKESGDIYFQYKTTVIADGTYQQSSTDFWGKLDENHGSGEYRFGRCFGKWSVARLVADRNHKSTKGLSNLSDNMPNKEEDRDHKKPYIVILANDIVEHGGMPKFKVKSGDVLEIIRDKTCLDGYSVCFEVRNPETGEFGFVTEERMRTRHRIVVNGESATDSLKERNNTETDVLITNSAIEGFKKYLTKPLHRAFAQAPTGPWGYQSDASSIDSAKSAALMRCQTHNERHEMSSPCEIVHINNEWIKK